VWFTLCSICRSFTPFSTSGMALIHFKALIFV
jgi:hypothetical protein